jgi:hypothetical protein
MNFNKILYFAFILTGLVAGMVFAEEKNTKQISPEENLPLNNPFAGSAGISSSTSSAIYTADVNNQSPSKLSDYTLSGVVTTSKQPIKSGYISLINKSGNYRILSMNESLNEDLSLIDITNKGAVFRRVSDKKELLLNFRGQVQER